MAAFDRPTYAGHGYALFEDYREFLRAVDRFEVRVLLEGLFVPSDARGVLLELQNRAYGRHAAGVEVLLGGLRHRVHLLRQRAAGHAFAEEAPHLLVQRRAELPPLLAAFVADPSPENALAYFAAHYKVALRGHVPLAVWCGRHGVPLEDALAAVRAGRLRALRVGRAYALEDVPPPARKRGTKMRDNVARNG